jgi:hypothetical protein
MYESNLAHARSKKRKSAKFLKSIDPDPPRIDPKAKSIPLEPNSQPSWSMREPFRTRSNRLEIRVGSVQLDQIARSLIRSTVRIDPA